nr:CPBP family intramembrane metalloprotease [Candidatus Sigynarchaeota archaeon]
MDRTRIFSAHATPEDSLLARKAFLLSLAITGIYLLVGFKWFFTLMFSSLLTEWQLLLFWPIYRYSIAACLFFFVPWLAWCKKNGIAIKELGWQWGSVKLGAILSVIGAVALVGVGFSVAADPSFKEVYPMARAFIYPYQFNLAGFIVMDVLYVVLYYFPYEFFFRGFAQFPLTNKGKVRATWVILYTTAITTALHWDVPTTELISAFAIGFIFGIAALKSNSIWYGLIFHIGTGLINDIVCLFLIQGWI